MAIFEFTGTVHAKSGIDTITARSGKEYEKEDVTFRLDGEREHPDMIVVSAFGEGQMAYVRDLELGEHCRVKFTPSAREYNGRWYNDLRVFIVERIQEVRKGTRAKIDQILDGEFSGAGQEDDLPNI